MIRNPNDIQDGAKKIRMLIAGYPGIGKSTLALSAPRPLHIDCDFGIDRIEPRYRMPYIQPRSYDEILGDLKPENVQDFETLVFDTAGKLISLMGLWAIKQNPKYGQRDGSLSLKGYGFVGREFVRLMDYCFYELKKNIVVVFHATEEKDGDNTRLRIKVEGQTKNNVWEPMDLGDTVEQVASKSGFSQSTIRRRVKLLSLDRDAFRRAELRGATLSDYAELDKIENVEDKNKALEALGTQNFRRVMQEILEDQKWEHRKAEWIAELKKFAVEDPSVTYQTHEHVTGYSKWNITKDVVAPEDADRVQYFYKVSSGQIDLYKTRDVAAEDAEKAKRDAAREEDRMIGESFHNITELMFNLRREFVVELAPADCKKGFPVIARYMACAADDNFDLDLNLIGSILGVELSPKFVDSSGKDWYKILDEDGVYGTMPEKVLLAIAYSTMDSSYCGYWDKNWNVESQKYVYAYRENPTLDATYEMLMALGYEISDDEQALRDGTHKIFREYGSDEKKWSDCDYCKAAHPNCDKCCKACDEPCNAVQDCKKNEERTENDE